MPSAQGLRRRHRRPLVLRQLLVRLPLPPPFRAPLSPRGL